MEHLEEHQHAFVKNGIVVWVGVFSDHDEAFLENLRIELQYDEVVCCCNLGYFPSLDWSWDGVSFTRPVKEPSPEYLEWLANNPQ